SLITTTQNPSRNTLDRGSAKRNARINDDWRAFASDAPAKRYAVRFVLEFAQPADDRLPFKLTTRIRLNNGVILQVIHLLSVEIEVFGVFLELILSEGIFALEFMRCPRA